jgi:membrane protein
MTRDDVTGFGKEFVAQFREDDASGMGAELAYRWLFAVFPFGLFLAALGAFVAAWLGIQNPAQQIIDGLGDNLPAGLASSVQPELERVIGEQRPGLASIGALAALWAATSGTMTVIKSMNRAYGVEETRPALKKYAIGIGLTVAGAAGLLVSFVTIVGGALLTEEVAGQLGLGATAWQLINIARWPLVFALLVAAVAVLLRVGPNMTPTWRWSLVGGAVFALGWLIATFGFALYVSNFANYGATYGALSGVIVLMLWFYLTAMILVAAGEVVAVLTKRTEPERLEERQEAAHAELAARSPIAAAREKVDGIREAVSTDRAGADARGEVTDAPRPTASPAAAPRALVVATPSPRVERSAPVDDGNPPARLVAAAAAAAAIVVAVVTSRLPRR